MRNIEAYQGCGEAAEAFDNSTLRGRKEQPVCVSFSAPLKERLNNSTCGVQHHEEQ